ncbi:hypothetical protein NQ315_004652 [Exocentrus adspersus]|uniref:SAM domain-containing protein n=1 Tax=Exocentrus adspersus TaxID=1586481 RepID=A0AAV8VP77_9CUCU|nr:hypothetical protein NQ315_004652 [Exocentrus adspersus]
MFMSCHSISGRFCSLDSLYRKPAAPSNFNAIDSDIKLNTYLHPDFSDINSRSSNHNEMTPMDVDFEERLDAVQQMDVSIPHHSDLNYSIDYNDINEIRLEFDNSGLFHELAVFRQLDIGQVRDWLGKQLKVQNINYDDTLLSNILHNHSIIYEGLKGLQSKLLLEREKLD